MSKAKTTKRSRGTSTKASARRSAQTPTWRESLTGFKDRIRSRLGRQTDDVWGLILLVIAVLLGLAFFGQAGPVGQWTISGLFLLFGVWSYLVPAAVAGIGIALIIGKPRNDYGRMAIGVFLTFVGTLAMFHLMTGAISLAASLDMVRDRGGAVGSLVAFPLRRLLGFWGALVILVALTGMGILILTSTTVRELAMAVGELAGAARRWAKQTMAGTPGKHAVQVVDQQLPGQNPPAKPGRDRVRRRSRCRSSVRGRATCSRRSSCSSWAGESPTAGVPSKTPPGNSRTRSASTVSTLT